jgi:hypothetical protein
MMGVLKWLDSCSWGGIAVVGVVISFAAVGLLATLDALLQRVRYRSGW